MTRFELVPSERRRADRPWLFAAVTLLLLVGAPWLAFLLARAVGTSSGLADAFYVQILSWVVFTVIAFALATWRHPKREAATLRAMILACALFPPIALVAFLLFAKYPFVVIFGAMWTTTLAHRVLAWTIGGVLLFLASTAVAPPQMPRRTWVAWLVTAAFIPLFVFVGLGSEAALRHPDEENWSWDDRAYPWAALSRVTQYTVLWTLFLGCVSADLVPRTAPLPGPKRATDRGAYYLAVALMSLGAGALATASTVTLAVVLG